MQHEASGRIGLNHVRVRPVMAAEGKATRRRVGRLRGADVAGIGLNISGRAQPTIGKNRQHRSGAAEVVGHQHEPPGRVNAHIRRTRAARPNGVEQL